MSLWPKLFDSFKFQVITAAIVIPSVLATSQFGTAPQPWTPTEYMTSAPIFFFAHALLFFHQAFSTVYIARMVRGLASWPFSGSSPFASSKPNRLQWAFDMLLSLGFGIAFAIAADLLICGVLVLKGFNVSMMHSKGMPLPIPLNWMALAFFCAGTLAAFTLQARLRSAPSAASV